MMGLLELQWDLLLGSPKPEKTILLLQNCQASQQHLIESPRKLLPFSPIGFPVPSPVSSISLSAFYLATTLVSFSSFNADA